MFLKTVRNTFETISKFLIGILSGLLFLAIAISTLFINVSASNAYETIRSFTKDNPVLNCLFLAGCVLVLYYVKKWVSCNMEKRRRILLIAEILFMVIGGLGFAAVSKCYPAADQASVYYGARHFWGNDFSELQEVGSYFSVYPHQLSLALAQELIMRIVHSDNYHFLQGVNALCNAITVWSLYSISDQLFEDKTVSVYTLLMTWGCLPLFWYTPFVYGDLASIAFGLLGVALLLKYLLGNSDKGWMKCLVILGSLFAFFAAALVRTNTLIFVLAVDLCLLVHAIVKNKPQLLLYIGILSVLCGGLNQAAVKFYELRSGNRVNDGMPAICHVVMGLQEGPVANGYYNGYNFDTYVYKADYNKKLAAEIAKNDLKIRMREFAENPGYAAGFFKDKFLIQWLSSDCECYFFTCGSYYARWTVVESLFSGTLFHVTSFYMDKYSFCVYAFGLIAVYKLIFKQKGKNTSILHCLLLAAIIGGALFYTIWEGSGRYILPYYIYTLPYAAFGVYNINIKNRLLHISLK